MKIRHERPMSDLSFQVRAPLTLELQGGKRVVIDSWSLSGFTFPEETDILPRQAVLSIPFQGVDIRFDVELEPGVEPRSLTFANLTGRQRETLAVFYRSILSGRMASTEDIITSLDTPVDLVPMGEKEEEKAAALEGKPPRMLRVMWNALVYALIAFVVFGVIGTTIYDRLSGIQLQHGRVVAPLVDHRFGEGAFVERIHVAPGDAVSVGDTLVTLNSPKRDGALDAVRIDIRQADRRLTDTKRRLRSLRARRDAHRATLVAAYEAAVARRSTADFFADRRLDQVYATWAALQAFDTLRDPVALEFDALDAELRDLRDEREAELRQLKRDLSNTKDAYDAINIIAQVDGVVRELPVVPDLHLPRGTLAAVVEADTHRQVMGWLPERAAQRLHVGQRARLRLATPTGSRSLQAKVVETVAGVDPAQANAFGVIVTLAVEGADLTKTRTLLRPDAPVDIRADRGWALTPYVLAFRAWWG